MKYYRQLKVIPKANTRIIAIIRTFLIFVKSILFSTMFLTPTEEIIPYRTSETPPTVADGIDVTIAANFGENENRIAKNAAILITLESNTFVRLRTPVFSPYVVLAGAPNSAARSVAAPSPRSVLCKPGSAIQFLPIVDEIAEISPICSTIVARAIGTIVIIDVVIKPQSVSPVKTLNTVWSYVNGRPIQSAFATEVKSTKPKQTATTYEPRTPQIIG